MDLGLRDKRVLVFASSSGLGAATAKVFAAEGARVAISARSADKLEATKRDAGAQLALTADLGKPGEGERLVREVERAWGGLDVLVTNAGGPPKGNFADITRAGWLEGFESLWLNVVSAMQAATPGMRERRFGRILLITSSAAKEPIAGLTVSNGLRAGLLGLMKSASRELAPYGVTVNALLPGYTKTERIAELGVPEDKLADGIPAGRLARPEELGALAAFLASTQGAYITGQAITVDGGLSKGL